MASFLVGSIALVALGASPLTYARQRSAPHYDGSISARLIFQSSCLDPLKANSNLFVIFDSLVSTDYHGHVRPGLALGWTFSHGSRWLTMRLRPGVRFSNGDPLGAREIKAEMDAILTHPVPWLPAAEPLQRVQAINKTTIRFIYSKAFGGAIDFWVNFPIVDVKADHALGDKSCQTPIGSAAFKVDSVSPGFNTITVMRNSLHNWGPPWLYNRGRAYLSSIVFKTVVDDTTAVNELLANDLDVTRVASTQVSRVQNNPDIKLHTSTETSELFLGFNFAHTPFDKPAVRREISEPIDRSALIKVAANGYAKAADSPIAGHAPFHDAKAKGYAIRYNTDDARKMLTANHVTGPFTLETLSIPIFATTAQFIQAQLAQVGINVHLAIKGVVDAQADFARGQMDMYVGIQGHAGDLYSRFQSSQTPDHGGLNFGPLRRVKGYHYVPGSNSLMLPPFEELYLQR